MCEYTRFCKLSSFFLILKVKELLQFTRNEESSLSREKFIPSHTETKNLLIRYLTSKYDSIWFPGMWGSAAPASALFLC